ncbi:hypothetical protein JTE90_027338 [Oedothorax gibbosus]|uniref:Uncharacterized protein n=1 Tax=Oedothorax gibbosus TaxID=931172 RepID=A0AAV6W375_9ARAC|nr:hypothetical protein JTE90_027338 [Oedothorax gibbosus]
MAPEGWNDTQVRHSLALHTSRLHKGRMSKENRQKTPKWRFVPNPFQPKKPPCACAQPPASFRGIECQFILSCVLFFTVRFIHSSYEGNHQKGITKKTVIILRCKRMVFRAFETDWQW